MQPRLSSFTGMGKAARPIASKRAAEHIVKNSTATAALTNPAAATAVASTWFSTQEFSAARLMFAGTDAANETVNYQVVLWYPAQGQTTAAAYFPIRAAKGTFTLGATVAPSWITGTTPKFADTITDSLGESGSVLHSPEDDGIATLDIDLRNAAYLSVETDLGTAASADVLCVLGESTSGMVDTNASDGGDLTFQPPIAIAQGAAGRTTVLALEASKVIRLHALVLTADAAGTVKVCYDDDGAGTNEVDLTGALPVGANGGFVIPFNAHPDGCLKTAAGKQLTIFSATSKMSGYAICSKHTS